MRKTATVAVVACAAVSIALGGYGLFYGYFDTGRFEVKDTQRSGSRIAVVAERSDDSALGGLTYFVLIGDHEFSPRDLKHAYYSDAVVFDANTSCVSLRWEAPSRLVVTCDGPYLGPEHISVEKPRSGDVAVSYANISPETAQTIRPK